MCMAKQSSRFAIIMCSTRPSVTACAVLAGACRAKLRVAVHAVPGCMQDEGRASIYTRHLTARTVLHCWLPTQAVATAYLASSW